MNLNKFIITVLGGIPLGGILVNSHLYASLISRDDQGGSIPTPTKTCGLASPDIRAFDASIPRERRGDFHGTRIIVSN